MRSLAIALFSAGLAVAHELDTTVAISQGRVTVKTTYAGSEPVPFAKVQVFSPASPGKELHSGATDKDGVYTFTPDRPGAWKFVVDDQEGHRREIEIRAGKEQNGEVSSTPLGRWTRAGVGVALLLGVAGAARLLRSRKSAGG